MEETSVRRACLAALNDNHSLRDLDRPSRGLSGLSTVLEMER